MFFVTRLDYTTCQRASYLSATRGSFYIALNNSQTPIASDGALDTITALLAFQYGMIPLTLNCEQLIPRYGLDLVQNEAQPLSRSTALIGGRGPGGANVVL